MTEGRGDRTRETPDITIHGPDDVVGGVTGGVAGGESGERVTGTPNTMYNLSSVLFHALQGGSSYDTYIDEPSGRATRSLHSSSTGCGRRTGTVQARQGCFSLSGCLLKHERKAAWHPAAL
jgi:hypothetical protein